MAGGPGLPVRHRPPVHRAAGLCELPWGCTDAGTRILAALRGLPKMMAARKPSGADHIAGFEDLVTGSWRRLVFASPKRGA